MHPGWRPAGRGYLLFPTPSIMDFGVWRRRAATRSASAIALILPANWNVLPAQFDASKIERPPITLFTSALMMMRG